MTTATRSLLEFFRSRRIALYHAAKLEGLGKFNGAMQELRDAIAKEERERRRDAPFRLRGQVI